ncbi:MAG: ABC transporter ATP-binding protein [Methanomassiliicoccus sp.]|nr:ABC transporter ATP-binding protein [Methanomassiliicoccus sp.]
MKAIEIEHLGKSIAGHEILRDVSLDVQQGDIFAFLGPNGAGKTTTMRIVLGLLNATAGSALVLGEDLSTSKEMRRKVGVLFERHGLYERLTVRDNLDHYARLFGIGDRQRKVEEVMEEVGIKDRGDDAVFTLSTGLKRRAGLARALLGEPEVLFLDEPTSSLDPQAQKDFRTIIQDLGQRRRMTVFLNTHNLDEVQRICSRVAILDRGSVRLSGTMEEIRSPKSMEVEVVLSDEGAAREAVSRLLTDSRVMEAESRGATVDMSLQSPIWVKELVEWGWDVKEYRIRSRTLDEVYFEVLGQGATA